MRKHLELIFSTLLKPLGLAVKTKKVRDRDENLRRILIDSYTRRKPVIDGIDITFIAFSKDRPLQLDGLIRSLQNQVKGNYVLRVLYSASSEQTQSQYRQLQNEIGDTERITWHPESNFKDDLTLLIEEVESHLVGFLVDDIIFIRPVDLSVLSAGSLNSEVFSLRLGKNINFNYMHRIEDKPPTMDKVSRTHRTIYKFTWGSTKGSWTYPASVDGHIFPTQLIASAIRHLDFKAPNSFESALQIINPVLRKMNGYCFRESVLVNIPTNCVQKEKKNRNAHIPNERLIDFWKEGKRIDVGKLVDIKTNSVHAEIDLPLYERNTDSARD